MKLQNAERDFLNEILPSSGDVRYFTQVQPLEISFKFITIDILVFENAFLYYIVFYFK